MVPRERVDTLEHFKRDRTDAWVGERNQIASECGAAFAAVGRCGASLAINHISRVGIVNLARISGHIQHIVAYVVKGNVGVEGRLFMIGDAQKITKEEEPIAQHRATDRRAGVVVNQAAIRACGQNSSAH